MMAIEAIEKVLEVLISVFFVLSIPTLFAFLLVGLPFLFFASAVLNPVLGLLTGGLGGFMLGIGSATMMFLSAFLPFVFADKIKADRNLLAMATTLILIAGCINIFTSYAFLEDLMMVNPFIAHVIILIFEIATALFLLYAFIENMKCLLGIEC